MSSFAPSSFKNFKQSSGIPIISKISQKDKRKNNKQNKKQNEHSKLNMMSDKDFENLMESNNYDDSKSLTSSISLNDFSLPIFNSDSEEKIDQIIQNNLFGSDLVTYFKSNPNIKISFLELGNYLLKKNLDFNDITWLNPDKYGECLKFFSQKNSNSQEQIKFLIMIQEYCSKYDYPKIPYKTTQVYLIRIIFTLLFTSEIIEESNFNSWLENLDQMKKLDEKTKNLLVVQTTEFFAIFKTVFADSEDDESGEKEENKEDENISNKKITPNKSNSSQNYSKNKNAETDEDEDQDMNDEEKFQDYNLDDI